MKTINRFEQVISTKLLRARQQAEENRHHRIHAKAAWWNINKAIAQNGWELTDENRKLCDEYAVRVFGKKEFAPWLYFFTLFSGEFKEGWIPLNYYAKYVLPDPSLARVSSVKTFSKVVLKTDALPDIGYYLNGKFYNKNFSVISLNELQSMLKNDYGEIFVKRDNSLRGLNNHIVGFDEISLVTFQNIGNCVIQCYVKEHQFFREIVESSTATIRIITVRNLNGQMEFRGSYLKLGRKDKRIYRSDYGIRVPVVDEFGNLGKFGYGPGSQQLITHPDTGVGFTNKRIPQFTDAIDLCLKLHASIPHFPIVGWDVTIDHENNIKLFEWNAGIPHPGIRTVQATLGPCFSGLGWEDLWR